MKTMLAAVLTVLTGCSRCHHVPAPPTSHDAPVPRLDATVAPTDAASADAAPNLGTIVTLTNKLPGSVKIYIAFGSDSAITAETWATWCTVTAPLNCEFDLTGSKVLPNPTGAYLNATFSAGKPVGCGASKAEVNANNPNWFDTTDVSLVDGYNTNIQILADGTTLGPTKGPTNNEKAYGVFPLSCDVCVAKQNPPCGAKLGVTGCKAGTQFNPKPPCQFQGPTKGGGGSIEVQFLGAPAVTK